MTTPTVASLIEQGETLLERLEEVRQEIARLSVGLTEAEYQLQVIKARVERALIKRVGGEKALAPTAEDRQRIFALALEADEDYRRQREAVQTLRQRLEERKAEERTLRDRFTWTLTLLRTLGGDNPGAEGHP